MNHYPLTDDQRQTLNGDLAAIMESLGSVAALLRASYGDKDSRVWRANEARGAVQRLCWAVEREAGAPSSVAT